jgi:hypothetical protein
LTRGVMESVARRRAAGSIDLRGRLRRICTAMTWSR